MIAGLCESPLTFQAVTIWRNELNDGNVFLHDIIDLEATYCRARRQGGAGCRAGRRCAVHRARERAAVPRGCAAAACGSAVGATGPHTRGTSRSTSATAKSGPEEGTLRESDPDEDDPGNSMSLAAIEAELKPKVLEIFDAIADTFKRLRRLQDQDIHNKLHDESLSPAQERKYKKLKKEIIVEMKSLRLNQARIDALVEQLYDINKRLVGFEGRLMRLAESHGVFRDDFLKAYLGSELDPLLAQPRVEAVGQGLEKPRRQGQGPDQATKPA